MKFSSEYIEGKDKVMEIGPKKIVIGRGRQIDRPTEWW